LIAGFKKKDALTMSHRRAVSPSPSLDAHHDVVHLHPRGTAPGRELGSRNRNAPAGGALFDDIDKYEHISDSEEDYRDRMRANLLAAILTALLLMTGAWLADELAEASQSCYPPDGGCEATGAPPPQLPMIFLR
jgi:hypothetical protein